jgi:hypothetical protein
VSGKFYVYAFIVDGVLRYIGKGSGWRAKQHLAIARRLNLMRSAGHKVKSDYFHNKLAKALRTAADIRIHMIATCLQEQASLQRERSEIDNAPVGQLWNQKSGGTTGCVMSPDLRERLSRSAKKRYEDLDQLHALRQRMKAIMANPEARAHIAAIQRRRYAEDPEQFRNFHQRAWAPDTIAKRAKTLSKTLSARPELRAHVSKTSRAWWADKSNKEVQSQKLKSAWRRPSTAAKHRAYLDSPEGRAKLKAASEARWAKHRAAKEAARA